MLPRLRNLLTTSSLFFLSTLATAQGHVAQGASISGSVQRDLSDPLTVWYVDEAATGSNDGTSWVHAYTDLQDALGAAASGEEIWVAGGTYRPAGPGGPNDATFSIPSGVAVYGGFKGSEKRRDERDPVLHPVTLSADLDGDDTYTPIFNVGFGDNVWNVVTFEGTAAETLLDSFTIVGGSFRLAPFPRYNGAGIRIGGGSATIVNCEIAWCVANEGGGLFVGSGDALVEDGDFHNNYATTASFAGGAVSNDAGSSVTIRDTSFTRNTADGVAGGVAGGAIANASGASTTVERCSFVSNKAANRLPGLISIARGGAIYNEQGGTLVVRQSTFRSNTSNSGGAVFGWTFADVTLESCLFVDNWVTKYVLSGSIEGGGDGGTVVGGAGLTMRGCLVYGGVADNIGGVSAGAGLVSGCIFWGNTDDKGDIGISQVKADEVRYSCVENMLVPEPGEDPPDPEDFPGSIDADPLFANAGAGDFRLSPGSPAIDAGENSAWPSQQALDLAGGQRFVDDPLTVDTGVGPGPIVDMGPYEVQGAAALVSAARTPRLIVSAARTPRLIRLDVRAGAESAGVGYVALVWLEGSRVPLVRAAGALDADGAASRSIGLPREARASLSSADLRHAIVLLRRPAAQVARDVEPSSPLRVTLVH